MDSFIKGLLQRCVLETNAELRLLVSISLGEIGAISPTYIDRDANFDADNRNDGKRWIIEKGAPWKSNSVRIHYELQLVTNHFVTALKAAPTPTDQHKIAFAIQEGKTFICLHNTFIMMCNVNNIFTIGSTEAAGYRCIG